MVTDTPLLNSLSLWQRILLTTDGTVTDLVQLYSGSPIRVQKLAQSLVAFAPSELALEPSELEGKSPLLQREILLQGAGRNYIYAHSLFVLQRMSETMREALLNSDTPIGLIWQRERLESYREILDVKQEHREDLRVHFPDAPDDRFLSRSYRVFHRGKPLGMITEKFPLSYFTDSDHQQGHRAGA